MRECPKCHRFLTSSEFYRDRSKKDGLGSYCKKCSSEHNKQYHKERLENHLCYDCGKPIPTYWDRDRYCPDCYEKRLELNKTYEQKRVNK